MAQIFFSRCKGNSTKFQLVLLMLYFFEADVEDEKIIQLGKKTPLAMEFIRYFYSKPIVGATEIANALQINISTAHRLVQDFENLGILKKQTGYKRNRAFVFEIYLNLFK